MERAVLAGRNKEIVSRWRILAAAAIVVILVCVGAILLPAYIDNWRFQGQLDSLIRRPETHTRPTEFLRVDILNEATKLGIPLNGSQLEIARREGSTTIRARYVIHIDFPLYTVDLHLRAAAGGP